jgi:hypothetical protein|nr:MAG TPA: ParB protein [Caudoviricetes sp.]
MTEKNLQKTEMMKISEIKPNPNNPRIIKDEKFKKLVQSIKDFPEMLELRPIVINTENIVLGGNMRLKACQEAGLKEVPIIRAENLTPEQQQEFIVKDNVSFGEWDWDMLANEWDTDELKDWGLDVLAPLDYEDKNEEIDVSDFEDEGKIVLKFPSDQYEIMLEKLAEKRAELGLEENAQVIYYLLTQDE